MLVPIKDLSHSSNEHITIRDIHSFNIYFTFYIPELLMDFISFLINEVQTQED